MTARLLPSLMIAGSFVLAGGPWLVPIDKCGGSRGRSAEVAPVVPCPQNDSEFGRPKQWMPAREAH